MKTKIGIIVDGYGPGNLLPEGFIKNEIELIHVSSQQDNKKNVFKGGYDSKKYNVNLEHIEDFEVLVTKIEELISSKTLTFSIPGSEMGVDLAEHLASRFKLPTNDISIGRVRRDKFLMQEQLRKSNLRYIRGIKVKSIAEALTWLELNGIKKSVIKPLDSAGCDSTKICQCPDDVQTAIEDIIGVTNIMGGYNDYCMVQEFVSGLEITVNTFSYDGEHYITDSWTSPKTHTSDGTMYYTKVEPLKHSFLKDNGVDSYIFSVLDSLGIKNGPSHCEVLLSPLGPVLVESAARLDGLLNPNFLRLGLLKSGLDLLHEMNSFRETFILPKAPYEIEGELCIYLAPILKEGLINLEEIKKELSAIPELVEYRLKVAHNEQVKRTIDLTSASGCYYLKGASQDELNTITDKIGQIIHKWIG